MMINKCIFLIIILSGITGFVFAGKRPGSEGIRFSGRVDLKKQEGRPVSVYFVKEYTHLSLVDVTRLEIIPDQNGNFSFEIPGVITPGKLNIHFHRINHYYIAEPGDDIKLSWKHNRGDTTIVFSGLGSKKYEAREKIEAILNRFKEEEHNYIATISDSLTRLRGDVRLINGGAQYSYDNIHQIFKMGERARTECLKQLNYYPLDPFIKQLMYADILGSIGSEMELYSRLYYEYTLPLLSDSNKINNNMELLQSSMLPFIYNFSDSVLKLSKNWGYGYVNFVLKLEQLEAALKHGFKAYLFNYIYEKIKNKYSGYFRESLLTYLIVSPLYTSSYQDLSNTEAVAECINDAYYLIKTPRMKELVGQIRNRSMGNAAYNFAFPNEEGEIITLESLRGKVVLLDIWFTGCTFCAGWANRFQQEIYPKIKNKEQFAVVSINADESREKWLSSMKTNKYTDRHALNISSYPMNKRLNKVPMMEYYYVSGAPFVMLIDENGKIVVCFSLAEKDEYIIEKINSAIANKTR